MDWNEGDGIPNCPTCGGRGVVDVQVDQFSPPAVQFCRCVKLRDIAKNLERGWKGLFYSDKIQESPLTEKVNQNLWVTSPLEIFKAHLRYVAMRQGSTWNFKVVNDVAMMHAWLLPIKLRGETIFDADLVDLNLDRVSFEELVGLPQHLVIRVGVKAARNEATPEVLEEALLVREHAGKFTWIVDQPDKMLNSMHICGSANVQNLLATWEHLELAGSEKPVSTSLLDSGPQKAPNLTLPGYNSSSVLARPSNPIMRNSGAPLGNQTKTLEIPERDTKKNKNKNKWGGKK